MGELVAELLDDAPSLNLSPWVVRSSNITGIELTR